MQRLYERGYGIHRLAKLFNCSTTAIIDELLALDLVDWEEMYPDELPQLRTTDYERIEYGAHRVRVHRLLMVAECGFEAVANAVEIHHESVRWDNRPDALVLCETRQEHKNLHAEDDGDHENQQELSEFGEESENQSLEEFIQTRGAAGAGTS